MADQITKSSKRLIVWTMSAFLLTTVGCAFPQGRYGGDPMCGNFNRPIAPTPPVWGGGDPGHSPAYDGGAHLGQSSPDILTNPTSTKSDRGFIVPTYSGTLGLGGFFRIGGGNSTTDKSSAGDSTTPTLGGKTAGAGAKLPGNEAAPMKPSYVAGLAVTPTNANSVSFRTVENGGHLTSGANFAQTSPKKISSAAALPSKDPTSISSVDECQIVLTSCGVKSQRLEQELNGEWKFICTLSTNGLSRHYEAISPDQLGAMRAALKMIQEDK